MDDRKDSPDPRIGGTIPSDESLRRHAATTGEGTYRGEQALNTRDMGARPSNAPMAGAFQAMREKAAQNCEQTARESLRGSVLSAIWKAERSMEQARAAQVADSILRDYPWAGDLIDALKTLGLLR